MFTIIPMSPVVNNLNTFGPEVSLGERLHSLTGRSIVLKKYCWGGSSAQFDWNSSTPGRTVGTGRLTTARPPG